jgi:hypothetical protein
MRFCSNNSQTLLEQSVIFVDTVEIATSIRRPAPRQGDGIAGDRQYEKQKARTELIRAFLFRHD